MTMIRTISKICVGVHVSIAGAIDKAVDRAEEQGCNTFQIFTRNPRNWKSNELDEIAITSFIKKVRRSDIFPTVGHMPYLPNLATPSNDLHAKSVAALTEELKRCKALQIPYLVAHLGSHRGSGREAGLQKIVDAINIAFREVSAHEAIDTDGDKDGGGSVMLLLENTAGTKNSMGGTFEDIRDIMDRIEHRELIGICFDTCHAFAAGYDLRGKEQLDATLQHLDEVVGLEHLKLIHINDAKSGLSSRVDRHEHIGLGKIGEDSFRLILNDARIKAIPMILETPIDGRRGDAENIRKVRELAGQIV